MSSINRDRLLWVQDDPKNSLRRAYVESPEFYGPTAMVPFGIDEVYRKYVAPDEALDMAKALIRSVHEALQHSMEPQARENLEGQLDAIVIVTRNALRWRRTPRKVDDE